MTAQDGYPVKHDRRAGRGYLRRNVAVILLAAPFAVGAWLLGLGISGLGGVLLIAIGAVILGERQFVRTYRCPECGGPTERPARFWSAEEGERLYFVCHACRIRWDLGLRGSSDAG
ncbi:MAG: hypothetical protein AAFR35_16235 [Pseudomonadota bacterium]